MNHLSRPLTDTPDGSLDDTAEAEPPSTATASVAPERPCAAGGLRVLVEYVVVDGEDAQALAQRQDAAIREVLTWLYARHSATPEGGQAETGQP
ncbi:hypothetical protein ACIHAR_34205 [Streptomyces sp. NPDC052016]|uniref:hypothetical protein n=1 Tax=Streptomyces sp. NPDC052016 TaxID=3365680 RepID=UPI0037CD0E61